MRSRSRIRRHVSQAVPAALVTDALPRGFDLGASLDLHDAPRVDENSLALLLLAPVLTGLVRNIPWTRQIRVIEGFPLFTAQTCVPRSKMRAHGPAELGIGNRVRGGRGGLSVDGTT